MSRLANNKLALVEAHRKQDWESAKQLSQERQRIKKVRYCPDCGLRTEGIRCSVHAIAYRFYRLGRTLSFMKALMLLLSVLVANAAPFLAPTNPLPVVQLAWDVMPGAASYHLYYGVASGLYTNAAITTANTLAVTLPTRGVTYFFAVTQTVSNLESAFSTEVSYTPMLPPSPPSGFKPPVTLSIQYKNSLQDFQWADLFDFTPTDGQWFRLWAVAASQVPMIRKVQPPPLPGQ